MKRLVVLPLLATLACLLLAAPAPAAEDSSGKKKSDDKKGAAPEAAGEDKPFDTVVKDMQVLKGLFTLYRSEDDGKTYLEILPSQLDTHFLFAATLDQSIGERGFYAAMMGADFPFYFHRVGKSVQWIQRNTRFTAPPGSPSARAMARSFPNSVLGQTKILSKPHPTRKSLLVDAADLFALKDLPAIAPALNERYQPASYKFDKDQSALIAVKTFDESVLFEVALHYSTDNPKAFSATMPDPRSVPFLFKYQLSGLKSTDYKPRRADDRVGHFCTVQQDYTSDREPIPFLRYIARWNLVKADPGSSLSPPKQPIVFWLENTIPVEYREAMAEGALLWNKAFERIGFKDVIVVRQQPDDATWDPADTRYNTIRWFQGVDAGFAIGPSRANPFTGEIYDADIGFSDGIVRGSRRFAEEYLGGVGFEEETWAPLAWGHNSQRACTYGNGMAQQLDFGRAVLEARGDLPPELAERLVRESLIEITAHEVGHTLGLRHNFRATTLLPPEDLYDRSKTDSLSQSSSVMDYNPIVVAPKGKPQGHFVPVTLGPYDYWAIEYAYKPIEGDEKAELARIAARGASDAMLPYSTDEDADGAFPTSSIDPLATRFDQSSDPIAFFRDRVGLVNDLWTQMDSKLVKPGEGYQVLRRALGRGLNDYARSTLATTKYVGGIYHRRDHHGDPGERPPYTPVPAAKQREALQFLASNAFGAKAFQLPPRIHRRLAIERLEPLDWPSYYNAVRIDYPWHDAVLSLQRILLDRLFSPVLLSRLVDNELRFEGTERPFRMAELFGGLDAAIWAELAPGMREIPSLRRNVQREHLRQLIRMTLRHEPPPPPNVAGVPFGAPTPPATPEDASTLARASLVRLQGRIRTALASKTPLEATTRAHLQETASRIAATLDARVEKRVD